MRRGALRCQDTVLSPHCEARTTEHAHVARARTHPMFCTHKSNSRVRPGPDNLGVGCTWQVPQDATPPAPPQVPRLPPTPLCSGSVGPARLFHQGTGWRGAAGRRTRSSQARSWCFGRGRQSRLGGRGQAVLGASMTGGADREIEIWSVLEDPANREHP